MVAVVVVIDDGARMKYEKSKDVVPLVVVLVVVI